MEGVEGVEGEVLKEAACVEEAQTQAAAGSSLNGCPAPRCPPWQAWLVTAVYATADKSWRQPTTKFRVTHLPLSIEPALEFGHDI